MVWDHGAQCEVQEAGASAFGRESLKMLIDLHYKIEKLQHMYPHLCSQ